MKSEGAMRVGGIDEEEAEEMEEGEMACTEVV
jgi:hypothetical protein